MPVPPVAVAGAPVGVTAYHVPGIPSPGIPLPLACPVPVSPVYVHGPAGTGKSHLVAALAEHVSRAAPRWALTVLPASEVPAEALGDGEETGGGAGWRHG